MVKRGDMAFFNGAVTVGDEEMADRLARARSLRRASFGLVAAALVTGVVAVANWTLVLPVAAMVVAVVVVAVMLVRQARFHEDVALGRAVFLGSGRGPPSAAMLERGREIIVERAMQRRRAGLIWRRRSGARA